MSQTSPDGGGKDLPFLCPNCGMLTGPGWTVTIAEPKPGAVLDEDGRCQKCGHEFGPAALEQPSE